MYQYIIMYQYSIYVFNIWISNYQNNLQYMGLSNTSIINLQHMELWVIGVYQCNREEPLDDIKHSIYSH